MSKKQSPPSRMRYRLTLQTPQESADGAGGVTRSWSDEAELWADVEPVAGKELWQAGQVAAVKRYQITVRTGITIDETMRFLFEERILAIRSVTSQKNGLFEIIATEEPEE